MIRTTSERLVGRRSTFVILATLATLCVAAATVFGTLWFQRPPIIGADDDGAAISTQAQLWGDCCQDQPRHMRETTLDSPMSESRMRLRVSLLGWLDGTRASVDGDHARFTYHLSRAYWPHDSAVGRSTTESVECTATDVRAGDSITNGPVTIEVLAIHDMPLNRNNAIDLRITFDPDGIDDAPFDGCG